MIEIVGYLKYEHFATDIDLFEPVFNIFGNMSIDYHGILAREFDLLGYISRVNC